MCLGVPKHQDTLSDSNVAKMDNAKSHIVRTTHQHHRYMLLKAAPSGFRKETP